MNEAHDPRFGIFVATLIARMEYARNATSARHVTFDDLLSIVEYARLAAFGDAD